MRLLIHLTNKRPLICPPGVCAQRSARSVSRGSSESRSSEAEKPAWPSLTPAAVPASEAELPEWPEAEDRRKGVGRSETESEAEAAGAKRAAALVESDASAEARCLPLMWRCLWSTIGGHLPYRIC